MECTYTPGAIFHPPKKPRGSAKLPLTDLKIFEPFVASSLLTISYIQVFALSAAQSKQQSGGQLPRIGLTSFLRIPRVLLRLN